MTYILTNIGSTRCTIYGYPGVSIIDAQQKTVQHPAVRATRLHETLDTVTLTPGRRGYFLVTSEDTTPSPGCPHSFQGQTLRVFPPNNRAALYLADDNSFCNLTVGPVTAAPATS